MPRMRGKAHSRHQIGAGLKTKNSLKMNLSEIHGDRLECVIQ